MLDAFQVFTKGGLILFSWTLMGDVPKGAPVEALVKTHLLEERGGAEREFTHQVGAASHALRWTTHNERGLVFVATYQSALRLTYVDDLLERVKRRFVDAHHDASAPERSNYDRFEEDFTALLRKAEAGAESRKAPKAAPAAFDAAKKAARRNDASGAARRAVDDDDDDDAGGNARLAAVRATPASANPARPPAAPPAAAASAFDMSKIGKLKARRGGGGSSGANLAAKGGEEAENKTGAAGNADGAGGKGKKPKEKRVWVGENAKGKVAGDLDFSGDGGRADAAAGDAPVSLSAPSRVDADDDDEYSDDDDDDDRFDEADSADPADVPGAENSGRRKKKKTFLSGLMSSALVRGVVGKPALDRSDVEPILERLKTNFMNKNVAEDIAERLCESVAASLVGQRLASFSSLTTLVRSATEAALTRILTPKRSVDVLREVRAAREAGRPYVVAFVGVNGVGKSTNLSKVAYWLAQHDVRVMIAACDTFRAGAVEQLRTHCKRLDVPLFERGYEKDPSAVASEAIRAAQRAGVDAVLIDTAGRMQDNEPLMRALAKLINVNEPDLTLFVGEALVGNDAVDQLVKFNERLSDLSADRDKKRLVDGIVLSKFDTVDDKVGAALSMVYASGAPVMFVGCGQTYTDLRKLNVKSVVKILLRE